MPMMLELFSGTGSVGRVASEMGFDVISLDRDMEAHIQIDIMDWDYTDLPASMFDVIWANPPCAEMGMAKTCKIGDVDGSDAVVKRVVDIIEYFKPKYWIVENSQNGLIKFQQCMEWIPFNDVDYCHYGLPYKKRTRMWNNIDQWHPKPLCKRDCNAMNEARTRHKQEPQQDDSTTKQRIPPELIKEILSACDMTAENASDAEGDIVM